MHAVARGTLLVALAATLGTPPSASAVPGDLDPSFGTNGVFIQAFGPASSNLKAVVIQPDGKIVAAGWSQQSASAPTNSDFQLLRLNANGTIDNGFGGGDGSVTTPISAGTADDAANAVALGPNGTIYVAGGTDPPGGDSGDIAVARYDSSGTLDGGFGGGDGIVVLPQPNFNTAFAIQVQADGKPVIAGPGPFVNGEDWLVARFETDADLDPTFNAAGATPGINTTSFTSSSDTPFALQILGDGRLLTAGARMANSTSADVALAQFTSAGVLDTAGFGAGTGKATLALPEAQTANALAIDASGRPVVAGEQFNVTGSVFKDFLVGRFSPDGSPDTSFSGDGAQMTPFIAADGTRFAKATGVAIQPDGRILASGDAFINCPGLGCADFALARYTDNGEPDPEFGNAGTKTLGIGADNDLAYALVLQPLPTAVASRGGQPALRALMAGASGNSGDTVDRPSLAAMTLGGCPGLRAEKVAAPLGTQNVDRAELDIHVEKAIGFKVKVTTDVSCKVTIVETPESLATFKFNGSTTATGQTPTQTGFAATVAQAGVLTNTVRVTASTGETVFASARVNAYSNFTGLNELTYRRLEGLAKEYSKAFPKPPTNPPPGDGVKKVEIGVLINPPATLDVLAKPKCEWLTKRGSFKSVKPDDGACDEPIWITAKLGKTKRGTTPFSYEFKRDLPPGKYIAYSRSTNEAGVAEPEFTKKLGNEQPFKVKR